MSKVCRSGRYDRPVPEPHFIPGYTGHCPDLADHIGMAYPWATYIVLEEKPALSKRLSPIKAPIKRRMWSHRSPKNVLASQDEDNKIIRERRASQKHPLLGVDIAIGYGGHVPKIREVIGKTHEHVFRQSIADFERQQRSERRGAGSGTGRCCCCTTCCCQK